jgi:predicted Zn-dependent peptidase
MHKKADITPDRSIAPRLRKAEKLNYTRPETGSLSNGIPFYIIDSGDQDIIRVDFCFQAGSRYQEKVFQSYFTNSLLPEGTSTRSSRSISDELDFYGSYLNPVIDRDEAGLQLYSLGKFLPATLDITADTLMNPVFPEEEIEILRQNRIQGMLTEEKKVESRARKTFFRTLFGPDHPYGQTGEISDLDEIRQDDLIRFHNQFYRPRQAYIIISGRNAGRQIKLIEERFGHWNLITELPEPQIRPIQKTENLPFRALRENVPGAVQAAIRMGCITPAKNHPDFSSLSIVNTILGGYFGSRLMQNIRENKGYTYGIGSSLHSFREAGVFILGTEVGVDYYLPTLHECYSEIQILSGKPVGKTELKRVKQHIGGELVRQLDGPYNQAESLKSLISFGMDFDFIDHYLKVLNDIGPEEIRSLTTKYLNPDNFVEVVAGAQDIN